jgi:DnaD/phage-associated family protein
LLLYVFWHLDQQEGPFRYIIYQDIISDDQFMSGMGNNGEEAQQLLDEALHLAVDHCLLMESIITLDDQTVSAYFLNSPKGRAAVAAIARGEWQPTEDSRAPIEITPQESNIFRLYQENIGPLTPIIADALGEAEDTYPGTWIDDAFRIAVEKNNRNWRYIAAILENWQRKGRYERKDRRDSEEARRRYAEWED